ncbi:MAG: transporter substrate-binding domain-containing protein [Spirochaetaceae bacterium]|jgi:polar amino acid transport system substrate-binding protein|nr:transporter substrate-binding domain-containing protein [Spirochaetaceae bacterium]
MQTKKIFFTAMLTAALASGVFAKGSTQQTEGSLTIENGVFAVGMAIEYPPLEYYDADGKTPIGFDVQLAKALADQLGLKVKYVDTAWDGIFAGLNTGKYDAVISGVTITPDRIGAHNFTKPYIGNAMTIVLLKDSGVSLTKPEDIAGYRVCYQAETTANIYADRLAEQGVAFTPFEYDNIMQCFEDLRHGRVDIILVDSLVASNYVAGDSPFKIVWQGTADEKFGICLKKGNNALTDALNTALDKLFANGTMTRISQNIFKQDLVSSVR